MSQVTVIGSGRASVGVGAAVRRVRDALAAEPAADGEIGRLLVVDPGAWYAAQPTAPSGAGVAGAVALSLAPYGSPRMRDDAEAGRLFGAIAHPEARSAELLARLGCAATHVPMGCRPAAEQADSRPLDVLAFGPGTPRRLRALAGGVSALDDVRYACRFDEELPADDGVPHPLAAAHVLLDIAADDDAAPDLVLLLEALEAGTAVVTERLGELPAEIAEALVRAPLETVFIRARELAADPDRAAALAAAAHAAAAAAFPLPAMGHALAQLLDDVGRGGVTRPAYRPQLSHDAAPSPKLTVRERLHHEQCRPDVTIREGVRAALGELRSLERRLARIEGGAPDETTLLHAPSTQAPVLVSVLVPAFNARRLLPEALQSVERTAAEPDAPALEVIVVDDGSPQDDGAAAVEWAGAHPELPITVLRHRYNRGLAAARNTALERARGELVLPLDADNALLPGGLERLLGAMAAEPDAVFAYGLLQERDALDPVGLRGLYPWDPARLRYGNYIDALALIRRAALQELGGYVVDMPEQGYEDWDLWCRFAESGAAGAWIPQLVAAYRVRPDSLSAALQLSHVAPLADMLERHPSLLG